MIDIHTHLLNNVDDGSREAIESLTSLKLAEEAGFTDIILTPHYIEDYYENSYEYIKPKIDELKTKLYENNILVRVHQGNEVYISDNIGELITNNIVSKLARSRYLLFELPQNSKILTLDNLISQIKSAGCVPIMAHPERYSFVQDNPNVVAKLISNGVLMQCNYGSIIGQYGKMACKTMIKLLKNNMVHFLATDTHRQGYVYGHFYKVEREIKKYVSDEKFNDLTTNNAQNILENNEIQIEKPCLIRKKFFFI
ncbi:MAG: hypothetical protein E7313_02970 [Clostridiales bacterium]|nr:hypothetical protein [Clostridiales bacterium]